MKTQLSCLVLNGKLTTTPKRAKVLKAYADYFFSRLIRLIEKYPEEKDSKRECIRVVRENIYGEDAGKKVIATLLPKFQEGGQKTSFVADYKLGYRAGDGSEKVMLKLL